MLAQLTGVAVSAHHVPALRAAAVQPRHVDDAVALAEGLLAPETAEQERVRVLIEHDVLVRGQSAVRSAVILGNNQGEVR